jgi:hypothetical protein
VRLFVFSMDGSPLFASKGGGLAWSKINKAGMTPALREKTLESAV